MEMNEGQRPSKTKPARERGRQKPAPRQTAAMEMRQRNTGTNGSPRSERESLRKGRIQVPEERRARNPRAPRVQRPPLAQSPDPVNPQDPARPTLTLVLPEAAASSGVSQGHCDCPGLGPGSTAL